MPYTQRLSHAIAGLDRYLTGVQAMRAAKTYHKYVFWHSQVMDHMDMTDPGTPKRGPAHRGPAFLPWHREFIWRFERDLKAALGQDDFGLPYWNWAADKTDGTLATSRVWNYLGANTGSITFGGAIWNRMTAQLTSSSYVPIDTTTRTWRSFDTFHDPSFGHPADIKDRAQADAFMAGISLIYDSDPWNAGSFGFRGTNERDFHDHVHVLVGGDLADMAQPVLAVNDPIFFLHHSMVDRLWARWQDALVASGVALGDQYHPTMSEAIGIQIGQRIDEPMWPWSDQVEMDRWGLPTEQITPRSVFDTRSRRLNYVYDDQQPDGCLTVAAAILRQLFAQLRGQG